MYLQSWGKRRILFVVSFALVFALQVGSWWTSRNQLAPAALYGLLSRAFDAVDPMGLDLDAPGCVVTEDRLLSDMKASKRTRLTRQAKMLGIELYEKSSIPGVLSWHDCARYSAESGINFPVVGQVAVHAAFDEMGGYDVWLVPVFGHWLTVWQRQTRF